MVTLYRRRDDGIPTLSHVTRTHPGSHVETRCAHCDQVVTFDSLADECLTRRRRVLEQASLPDPPTESQVLDAWDSGELSEGLAAHLLGCNRLQARDKLIAWCKVRDETLRCKHGVDPAKCAACPPDVECDDPTCDGTCADPACGVGG